MRKSSWVVLGVCAALVFSLGFAYLLSRASDDTLTQAQATQMVGRMQEAVAHKDVSAMMAFIDPDPATKVAGVNQDQLRFMLARALRAMDHPRAEVNNMALAGGSKGDATVDFDLAVKTAGADFMSTPYMGHITLHLKRVEVPHLLGLYHTYEWRVVSGSTTGPQPTDMGE